MELESKKIQFAMEIENQFELYYQNNVLMERNERNERNEKKQLDMTNPEGYGNSLAYQCWMKRMVDGNQTSILHPHIRQEIV